MGELRLLRSNTLSLSVISIPPASGKPPVGLVVALHGWGAKAQDLASVAPLLRLHDYQFLFPNAPFPQPYVRSGGWMWYSFTQAQESLQKSHQELTQSKESLTDWLKSLESSTGVPLSRTILCGFSQGGAMTLDVGLNLPLAGLVVLSGYLHPITQPSAHAFPPVLIVHGRFDSVVPLSAAQKARDTLKAMRVAVQYHEFDMAHEIRPEVLELIQNFVTNNISS
jgi:phospholipase/carboxylesterase